MSTDKQADGTDRLAALRALAKSMVWDEATQSFIVPEEDEQC